MAQNLSTNGSPSQKDEQDSTSAESQLHRGELPGYTVKGCLGKFESSGRINRSGAIPQAREKFEQFLKGFPQWVQGKLQERQHALSHSPPNSPGRVKPLGSPREDAEDEVMQVNSQGNNFTIPQDLAEQIDAINEEEVDPESLLLGELHSRYLHGELNSADYVRTTFETLLSADRAISVDFMYDVSLRLMQSSDPIGLMARNYAIKQDQMIEEQKLLCIEDMARLQRQMRERSLADTAKLAKGIMQTINSEREKEFLKLKNEHRMLCVSNTLLTSDHELLKLRQSALTGVEGYAQCQQELHDAQRMLDLKTSVLSPKCTKNKGSN